MPWFTWVTSGGAIPTRSRGRRPAPTLGLPDGAVVVTFLGLLRRYKNVPHLVRTVRALPPERNAILLVAAAGRSSRRSRRRSSARRARIRACGSPCGGFPTKRCSATSVPPISSCCRSPTSPTREARSSRSPSTAPCWCRDWGPWASCRRWSGSEWVHTYEGDLTPAILDEAIAWARRPRPRGADLSALEWGAIAEQTLAFYRAVRRGAGGVVGTSAPQP